MPDLTVVGVEEGSPLDTIMMWSGLLSEIPSGWFLCDGNNGTPNLLDRFVKGAPPATEAGNTGGENQVVLTVAQMPNHNHSTFATGGGAHQHQPWNRFDAVRNRTFDSSGRLGRSTTGTFADVNWEQKTNSSTINNSGGGLGHENRPAFYEVAYIQRKA